MPVCRYTQEMRRILLLIATVLLLVQCSSAPENKPETISSGDIAVDIPPANTPTDFTLLSIKSWAYQLQNINVAAVGNSKFDLVVVDYSADGDDATAFSAKDVATMKGAGDMSKVVLAYMSIGEAENYRYYFNKNAAYVEKPNSEYPDNYKVYYWDAAWQAIIDSYLDRLIVAGFDGAYLDIIDAYEYFGPGGKSGLNRAGAAKDMVNFVRHIAQYARAKSPKFLIVPQNGSGILDASGMENGYLEVIDGIGAEDTFYYGNANEDNSLNEQTNTIANLDRFAAKGKRDCPKSHFG